MSRPSGPPWPFRMPLVVRVVLFLSAVALIWLSSQRHGSGTGSGFLRAYVFNLAHVPLYGCLGATFLLLWGRTGLSAAASACALLLVAIVGGVDEWQQLRVGQRSSSLLDVGSDVLGCAFLVFALHWIFAPGRTPGERRHGWALGVTALVLWPLAPVLFPDVPLPLLRP